MSKPSSVAARSNVANVKPCRNADDISQLSREYSLFMLRLSTKRWLILEAVLLCLLNPCFCGSKNPRTQSRDFTTLTLEPPTFLCFHRRTHTVDMGRMRALLRFVISNTLNLMNECISSLSAAITSFSYVMRSC